MNKKYVINIDQEKCNGCGICVSACADKVISIIDGKAKIINEDYCDGLGHCIEQCPEGALNIVTKISSSNDSPMKDNPSSQICPSINNIINNKNYINNPMQWPIKLKLINSKANYSSSSDILIFADCVPFIYKNFHNDFINSNFIVTGCPKFDDSQLYKEKLRDIFTFNTFKSIKIICMEVPCCHSFIDITNYAVELSNIGLTPSITIIGLDGNIKGQFN